MRQGPLILDRRWEGPHGIGRFATEIAHRLPHLALPLKGKPLSLLDPLKLQFTLNQTPSSSFHLSPGFNPPLGNPRPFFFTLHDLIHLEVPEESSLFKKAYYSTVIRPALHRAVGILTVSMHSKQRIVGWGGIPSEKVHVVGNGVSPWFHPEGPRWGPTPKPFFLYVGNHKPHKNVGGLLRAFEASGLSREFDLVLTGNPTSEFTRQNLDCHLSERIHFTGLLGDEKLAALYRRAHALVIPSWVEGFGLPLLEAMASGTPVLASQRSALPEIGQDAVAYFDPGRPESLVEGLRALHQDDLRDRLRQSGLIRARDFSWNRVAQSIKACLTHHGFSMNGD